MSLKVAMVGTGVMARRHSAMLAERSEVRLGLVCSTQRSFSVGREFQEAFGFSGVTTDLQDVLNSNIDAVYICTPDGTHPKFVAAAVKSGKHVFCEKPLARNKRGFEIIREAMSQFPGAILQVGMNCRYREQYSLPKDLVDSGELGELRFIRGIYVLNKVATAKRREKNWWLDHPQDVFFFLHANGVHILDLVRWYGGEVRSVFARSSGFELGEDFKADTFSISLEFANGALGEVLISSAAFLPRDISLQGWYEGGSFVETTVHRRCGEEPDVAAEQLQVVQETLDLGLQFEAFLRAIQSGTQPMNSFAEAYLNFRLIHAVERSLKGGLAVSLNVQDRAAIEA
jgi:myo-inositol 2-dehydrogenase / D-chiro-inositol 1-dehydrogenase